MFTVFIVRSRGIIQVKIINITLFIQINIK